MRRSFSKSKPAIRVCREGKNRMTSMKFIKRAYLASAAATALTLAMSQTAIAQDTDVEEITDEVVATGIRQSIEDSLKLKRDSDSIVDAITAEDIGKLPDVSIADSLARLPGVTAQRVRGRAQSISIRGLGPQFSLALLNGREVVSTSGNRGVEFDQFPSELIGQGIVYKTSDARLAATGIAGAVDLRTRNPLETEEGFTASARYVINDNGDLNPDFSANGYRLFGSGTFRNDADTLGLTVGITHQSNPTQIFQRDLKTQGTGLIPGTNTAYPLDNPRQGVESRDFERTSIAGTLQFDPSADISFKFDGFYSDFDDTGIFRGVETPLATAWTGDNPPTLVSSTGTGAFVDSVTYEQNPAILRTDTQGNEAEILALGGNVDFAIGEKTRVMFDVGYSEVSSNGVDYESYAGLGNNILYGADNFNADFRDSFTFVTPESGEYSIQTGRDYTDPTSLFLTDPGGWGQVGFIRNNEVEDELLQLRGEVSRDTDLPFIDGVVAGVLYSNRQKSTSDIPAALRAGAGFTDGTAPLPNAIGSTDSGSIGFDIVAYDPAELIGGTYTLDQFAPTTVSINEDVVTLYGMLNLGDEDSRFGGNLGLQYVMTDQESTGQFGTFGPITGSEATLGDDYSHWLPTLNLTFDATDSLVLRLGAGKAISRPQINDLSANLSVSSSPLVCPDTSGDGLPDAFLGLDPTTTNTCLSFGGGNPFLRPYETTYGDVSAEYYFSPAGAISVSGFVKDIGDYVQGFNTLIDDPTLAGQFLGADFVSANAGASIINVGGPANVGSGNLTGFEVALRLPFEDVVDNEFLSGFGINAAFTYADASVEFGDIEVDIPGYSSETASGEIYYEKNGFRARLNTRYRSGFRAEILQFNGQNIGASALSETIVDAQIGYDFDDRFGDFIDGTSINFEIYNITDEPFRTTNVTAAGEDFVRRREDYGTTYNFTIAKKF